MLVRITLTGDVSVGRMIARADVGSWRLFRANSSAADWATSGTRVRLTNALRGTEPLAAGHESTLVADAGDGGNEDDMPN